MSDTAGVPGTPAEHVNALVESAVQAFGSLADISPVDRVSMLLAVANGLEGSADALVRVAAAESHLPKARLEGELARTVFQFRALCDHVRSGELLEVTIDHADPSWGSGPRPDLRKIMVPVGPVVIFEASNFPFAFGVAGTDTASAFAAGCPVIVKAHSGHPQLAALTCSVVKEALERFGAPDGTFDIVYGQEAGRQLVLHPAIAAGAFTGSLIVGRALFDLAGSRPNPIPFYAEMGSINPVFVTESAMRERGKSIWAGYTESFSGSGGQLCTKPGVLVVPEWSVADGARDARVRSMPAIELLTGSITRAFAEGVRDLKSVSGVSTLVESESSGGPILLKVKVRDVMRQPDSLFVECFGPLSLVVTYSDEHEMLDLANLLEGQLAAAIHQATEDPISSGLLSILAKRVGRVIVDGWPTGVSVTSAMHHGGPYPASSTTHTAVGSGAVARFLRPVTYQDVPEELLPLALREGNPLAIDRRVDGRHELIGDHAV